jgi:hypothetical protein
MGGFSLGEPEQHRRTREADEGEDDGGDQGGLARGEHDAQGRIDTGPGSILSPGNFSPPESFPGSKWTKSQTVEDTTEER